MTETTGTQQVWYAWEGVDRALREFVAAHAEHRAFVRAYRKLLGVICVYAHVDAGAGLATTDAERSRALAYAWEDMRVAFAGYGDWLTTGAVQLLWAQLPRNLWPELRIVLQFAFDEADRKTPVTLPRRYTRTFRCQPVVTPDMKNAYDKKAAVPLIGVRMEEFLEREGRDPLEAASFRWMSYYDSIAARMGIPATHDSAESEESADEVLALVPRPRGGTGRA